ncbi:MAG: hypothetical protein A3C93_02850 [Candidatus Lloydbacteria bacterium RIFCSPHIGHO2_02_FULL_54_17]|uniref:Uncharacterized protein n=1 Tax=Candidatus Lloydbacteria bacterium RIFCSPHIGHO2_02_FULL_54_17 TaxID=1798664 RepID=A0A1G2DCJ1_9BACT|nr:MAG: hypothetical protein A2762_04720 [Candidatus Lloydbacteria bacterium RIFCSPHIGHO2_01_FULL_54_11]OGZ10610.1 MAG: hypothetical protein A3C93_02850 [Candidatus Lloydbacteria bacterium RIFCSPHIGHO2_02_FULL_54_17]OGZ13645.1 MAG: hypothetical protein A2948_03040 [Candidatus Lloydbacteria bacterium RIFCSPLOWO2_01_FULL_54_18]OGZ16082.1 MAG: hypothetical protein A3H76_01490 [Candidatus Lloydbacteria bacterium RIFCSPLOWO2_02_FULL_54_12]
MLETIALKWATFDPVIALGIFIAYALIDALYAKWTHEITRLDEWRSATTGGIMHVLIAFGVLNYTGNFLYVIPLVAGSWLGTFFYVRHERLRQEMMKKNTDE